MMTISPSSMTMTTRTSSRRTNWAPQAPTVERNAGLVSAFYLEDIARENERLQKAAPMAPKPKISLFSKKVLASMNRFGYSTNSLRKKPCGCGGIGRRVRFRSVWGQPHEGSSPFTRTIQALGTRLCSGSLFLRDVSPGRRVSFQFLRPFVLFRRRHAPGLRRGHCAVTRRSVGKGG